jgi:dienelactone hydrolase
MNQAERRSVEVDVTQALAERRRFLRARSLPLARPGRPSWRRTIILAVLFAIVTLSSTAVSTLVHLRVPQPTGAYAVGKVDAVLVDVARPEPATADAHDSRRLRVVAWYPATIGTGEPARYVSDLDRIRDALVASGEIGSLEVAGLGLVAEPARSDAEVADAEASYPVILLSPGNATNVEFYTSLAEELTSHGYVVIGFDHPYQVAAVSLDGEVAVYAGDPPLSEAGEVIPAKIDERVADIGFVLDRLAEDAGGLAPLAGHLDLDSIGVMGHSNGGIAAAQACADPRIDACLNIDGQLAGGPFSSRPEPSAPDKPFLYLTKERELHPALAALFEEGGRNTFRVVVPAASHDEFSDGPMFRPRVLPISVRADDVITVARGFSLAFFDHTLRDAPRERFGEVDAPTDVQVFVYPLVRPGS